MIPDSWDASSCEGNYRDIQANEWLNGYFVSKDQMSVGNYPGSWKIYVKFADDSVA